MTGTARRLGAAIVLAAGLGLALAPAASADPPKVTWTDPAPGPVPGEVAPAAVLTSVQQLAGVAEHVGGIDSVAFALTQDAARADEPCSAQSTTRPQVVAGRGQTKVAFAFDATFPCNLAYAVSATVTPSISPTHGRSDISRAELRILVAVPPTDVPELEVTPTDGAIRVRWPAAPNPAPDFLGYELRRAAGDGPIQVLASLDPDVTSFVDTTAAAGTRYQYSVVGVRNGPRPGTVVYSTHAAAASAQLVPPAGAGDETSRGSGTGAPAASGGRRSAAASPTTRRSPPTTADTGFGRTLPFKARPEPGATVEPATGVAIARVPGDDGGSDSTRQTWILVAGGCDLLVGAMVLRVIGRRVALG
jgi:hypothetical protein